MATREEVLDHLEDVDFPADKDALVAAAHAHGAPEDVLKALRAMPPVEYASRGEVAQSARTQQPVDATRAAAQAHDGHDRIAQSERDPGGPPPLR